MIYDIDVHAMYVTYVAYLSKCDVYIYIENKCVSI